jgi:GNAT superfamily N-acetyltransferase
MHSIPQDRLPVSWRKGAFEITTDPLRLDADLTYNFLTNQAEWSQGIPRKTFDRSIQNSLCFMVLHGHEQVGFARVISDCATIAYLGDVFVLPAWRGRGLSKWLMECIISHPDLAGLRRWILVTEDAHGLYGKYGFVPLRHPESFMEVHNPDVYRR